MPRHGLAVGCDDGVGRLFEVEEGVAGAQYRKSLPAVRGRLLSLAWHPLGGYLFVGTSVGTIHAWELSTNQELLRINAGDGSGEEQCVWAVQVLRDGTVVSGSSGGNIQFWDGAMGTLLHGFKRHDADVLALALAEPDEEPLAPGTPGTDPAVPPERLEPRVFASGVDSRVACFSRARKSNGGEDWVYVDNKRGHTHDVRSMLVVRSRSGSMVLLSGGNDAQLLVHHVYAFSQEAPVRICKCPEPVLAALATPSGEPESQTEVVADPCMAPGLLLTGQRTQLDLWLLGTTATEQEQAESVSGYAWAEGALVDVRNPPRHMARIAVSGGAHVMAAALSPAGDLVAYSSAPQGTRLVEIRQATGSELALLGQATGFTLGRRKGCQSLPAACQLAFAGRDRLALLRPDGELLIADASSGAVLVRFAELKADRSKDLEGLGPADGREGQATAAQQLSDAASLLCLAGDKWVAIANASRIHLYSLEKLKHHGQLPAPSEEAAITSIAFAPNGENLAAVTADNEVLLYDVVSCRIASWSEEMSEVPRRFRDMPGTVTRISFNPSPEANSALLHTASSLCHVSFSKSATGGEGEQAAPRGGKRRRREDGAAPAGSNFRVLQLENPCLFAAFTGPQSALLVEKAWSEVAATFPPPLYRHRYGT
eukprot:jgi/Botrbrau1/5568/Bobra.0023s0051.1